jgi:hypothetical protein
LKTLAKFPYEYDDYLFYGHSIPNGDPAMPYAENTQLSNVIIYEPKIVNPDFSFLKKHGREIFFFPIIPLYNEEMDYKLNNDLNLLGEVLDKNGVTEILNVNRKRVVKK